MAVLESTHPYPVNVYTEYTYTEPGAPEKIYVTFNSLTYIANDDYIDIYDKDWNNAAIPSYTNLDRIANSVFCIQGDTINIGIDGRYNYSTTYGFYADISTVNPYPDADIEFYAYPRQDYNTALIWKASGTFPASNSVVIKNKKSYDNYYSVYDIYLASENVSIINDNYFQTDSITKIELVGVSKQVTHTAVIGANFTYVNNPDGTVTFTDTSDFGGTRTGTYLGYGDTPIYQRWEFGDGTTHSEPGDVPISSVTHRYDTNGNFDVKLIYWGDNINSGIWEITHTLYNIKSIASAAIYEYNTYPDFMRVTFQDASVPTEAIVSWLWDFGDGTTSAEQHPVHTYTTLGAKTITLTVTDDLNNTSTDTYNLPAHWLSYFPVWATLAEPYIEQSEYNSIIVPVDTEVLFKLNITGGMGSPLTYEWNMGDGTTYNTTIPEVSHTYIQSGYLEEGLSCTITETEGPQRVFSFSRYIAIVKKVIAESTTEILSGSTITLGENVVATISAESFKPDSPNFESYYESDIYYVASSKIEEDIIVTKEEHKTEGAPYWENEYLHTIHFNGPCNRLGKFYLCAKFYKYKNYYAGNAGS